MILIINSQKYGIKTVIYDEEDHNIISSRIWGLSYDKKGDKFYVRSNGKYINGKRSHMLLHRLITGATREFVVDHKNGDTLDNRRENLRICTQGKNVINSVKAKNKKSSIYKGVCFRKREQLFEAKININRQRIYLGYFKTEIEAARAYNKKAIELFGEFALLNDIRSAAEESW